MADKKTKRRKIVSKKYIMCQNSEPDGEYWYGYRCSNMVEVDERADKVLCSQCVMILIGAPNENKKNKKNKPRGWHLKSEYIDEDGNVYHKGIEQPNLKKKPKKKKQDVEKEELSVYEKQRLQIEIDILKYDLKKAKKENRKRIQTKLEKEIKKMEKKLDG